MVVRDSQIIDKVAANDKVVQTDGHTFAMASPLDRFAASIIDYSIVLLPLLYLAISPFQRSLRIASLSDDQWQISLSIMLAIFVCVIIIMLYQIVCVWLWEATLGKAMMGLRVKSIWQNEKITFTHSIARAFYWMLSVFFLGAPFLAAFSNFMRRPIHDRAADTIVISIKTNRSVLTPTRQESSLVHAAHWTLGISISIIVVAKTVMSIAEWNSESMLVSTLEEEGVLCEIVSEAKFEWPNINDTEPDRINVAMALYAAEKIDRNCLEGEVENLFLADDESPLLYLAKSFVYSEHTELSNRYLDKVCELDEKSHECVLSHIIISVSEENWQKVEYYFSTLSDKKIPTYLSIWGAKQLLKREDYKGAQYFMSQIPSIQILGDLTLAMQTKILWGLNKYDEAVGVESAAYSFASDEVKLEIASFMCFEQIWSSCESLHSRSCDQMSALIRTLDDSLADIKTSLAFFRKWECEHSGDIDYDALTSIPLQADVKALAIAMSYPGADGFNDLIDHYEIDEEINSEISRRLIERTHNHGMLKLIAEEWAHKRQTLSWKKVGETLFNKYFLLKEYNESIKIANVLVPNMSTVSKAVLENAIVAAVKSGQTKRAEKFLSNYAQNFPLPISALERSPASSSPFTEIVRSWLGKEL
ncbi:MAG: hypothetical protein A2Z20_10455 [Bdellovibrionales bacterium RBG_16_40_8]|nr:MAG: hypothetical protein A2Z20_10455 [Bdellovibrionales bacterium RBG_16_40_8]